MHLLIIEDDLDLGRALQQALKSEKLSSQWVRRVADVRHGGTAVAHPRGDAALRPSGQRGLALR